MRRLSRIVLFVLFLFCLEVAVLPVFGQTNWAALPDCYEGTGWNIGSSLTAGVINYPVTFQGESGCVELLKNPNYPAGGPCNREMDSNWYAVEPGDHLVYRAYLWTNASAFGDSVVTDGARIGMDFYGALDGGIGRINEVGGAGGEADWLWYGYNYNYPNEYEVVPWDSGAWVQLELDFVVPAYYDADAWGSYVAGTDVVPTCFTAWVIITSVNSWAETGAIYFRDSELYINDFVVEPTPSATPVFTETPRPSLPGGSYAPTFVPLATVPFVSGDVTGVDGGVFLLCLVICIGIFLGVFSPIFKRN